MNPNRKTSGPDWLRELADRSDANGMKLEADMYRERAREWDQDKQAIDTGVLSADQLYTAAMKETPAQQGAFAAEAIEADFEKGRVVFRPIGSWRVRGGKYLLTPLAA